MLPSGASRRVLAALIAAGLFPLMSAVAAGGDDLDAMLEAVVDRPRMQAVDADAVAAPLERHGPRHLQHRRLAHAVQAQLRLRPQTRRPDDVDDAPAAEAARRRAEIDGRDEVEIQGS